MKVQVIKEIEVKTCDECPFFSVVEDTSVCEDSFDDPNYDFYCKHKDYKGDGKMTKYGKYIGYALSSFGRCEIPKGCPFKTQIDHDK